jgi:hypothetical protein
MEDVTNYYGPNRERRISLPTVFMHEICHALGLAHYDACNSAGNLDQELMYKYYTRQHQYAKLTCHAACSLKRLFCPNDPNPPIACSTTRIFQHLDHDAQGFEIYPTVVANTITLDQRDMRYEAIGVYRLDGTRVMQKTVDAEGVQKILLDLENVPAGNYFFVVFSKDRVESKLIKVLH